MSRVQAWVGISGARGIGERHESVKPEGCAARIIAVFDCGEFAFVK